MRNCNHYFWSIVIYLSKSLTAFEQQVQVPGRSQGTTLQWVVFLLDSKGLRVGIFYVFEQCILMAMDNHPNRWSATFCRILRIEGTRSVSER